MRETCRDFLRTNSASLTQLPGIPSIAVPLPANIGADGEGSQAGESSEEKSEERSEERAEELIISPFPASGHGHFPGHHKPFPIPAPDHIGPFPFPGMRPPPPHHAAPENVQQVFVEVPDSHLQLPNIGQIFPEKWPENLVAAFVPADWLADHVQINQDDYDDADYDEYYEDYADEDSDPTGTDLPEAEEEVEDGEDQYDEYYESV